MVLTGIFQIKLCFPCLFIDFFFLYVVQLEPALWYDSVNLFARGLQALDLSSSLSVGNMSCESEIPWSDGSSLFNYINSVS